jgi:hypothetical protein
MSWHAGGQTTAEQQAGKTVGGNAGGGGGGSGGGRGMWHMAVRWRLRGI